MISGYLLVVRIGISKCSAQSVKIGEAVEFIIIGELQ